MVTQELSDLLNYIAKRNGDEKDRIPALGELSQELGISVATLREQLEVARVLGVVEVKPRTGIHVLPYRFSPAVLKSISYGVKIDPDLFGTYADLRNHIETAYWYQAVSLLNSQDISYLQTLVHQAQDKLRQNPPQIPHFEHRELHLVIYKRLSNVFVSGLLEAYWDLYEANGLNIYKDIQYLDQVWRYHDRMVAAISTGDFTGGFQALTEHMDLISQRNRPVSRLSFE